MTKTGRLLMSASPLPAMPVDHTSRGEPSHDVHRVWGTPKHAATAQPRNPVTLKPRNPVTRIPHEPLY